MNRRHLTDSLTRTLTVALPFLAAAAGCTAANPDAVGVDPNDPIAGAPHALGQISLGEVHAPSGGTVTPLVSAVFVPDATLLKKCTTTVAGCDLVKAPGCGVDPGTGCKTADGEVCQYDDSCQPKCVKACTANCTADQECYFPSPDSPSCRKREAFDAGSLAFAGTTTPLTLFPPYSYSGKGGGAPFNENASLSVSASGATDAGFAAFQQSYTATTYLHTAPPLTMLTRGQVFGTGTVPIQWLPGQDDVLITASGPDGTATCKAMDAAGSFDLPRDVVTAVLGDHTDVTQQLTILVTRQKSELDKGWQTKGVLLTQTVQPEGWVELSTTSGETATIQGCKAGTGLCGGEMCIDLTTDPKNCGKCSNSCASGDSCHGAKCCGPAACDSCLKGADTGACMTDYSACQADGGAMGCAALSACVAACNTTSCKTACYQQASHTAAVALEKLNSCLRTACNSVCSC